MKALCFLIPFIHSTLALPLCSNASLPTQKEDICAKNSDYSKHANPDFPYPTTVHLDLLIRDILQVDEEKHLIEIVAYANLKWIESRIDIKSITQTDLHTVKPTSSELKQIWLTDVHYLNAISAQKRIHYYTATKDPKTGKVWFKLTALWKSQFTCEMDFSNYPFDSHSCCWEMTSYYENIRTEKFKIDGLQNEKDLKLATKDDPVVVQSKSLPFTVEMYPGQEGVEPVGSENKTIAFVQFKFTRKNVGRYKLITGFYLPTGLFATLCLISYLIKPEVVPGRMGMLVVIFLIFTNIYGSLEGPSSRGFSYIEVWYVGMFTPIVIAIAEYAIILAFVRYKTEADYETTIVRNRILKRWIADIDVTFLVMNTCFMIAFLICYYWNVSYLE